MKSTLWLAAALIMLGGISVASAETPSESASAEYVCTPCGMACDAVVHHAAGNCPECGQLLITRAAAERLKSEYKLAAILVFEGVQIIDFTGPYEVLGQARFEVYTVARTREPLTTAMGLRVTPTHDFAGAPLPDVVVIPGGDVDGAVNDPQTIRWVQDTSAAAQYTMSVCNGAFILAKAGLLDGASATTFYGLIDDLRRAAPKTKVVSDQRYVDNGRVMTTAGLSSGIDGTLHLIEKMYGHGRAQEIALHIEYDWQPESGFARASLADMHLPRLRIHGVDRTRTLSSEGTPDHWDKSLELESELSLAELAERISTLLVENGWARATASAPAASDPGESQSTWSFTDTTGRPWEGAVTISRESDGEYLLRLALNRSKRITFHMTGWQWSAVECQSVRV
jgi:putative intracellular protease/amidase